MDEQKEIPTNNSGNDLQDAMASLIAEGKKQSTDFQLKMLWILFESIYADINQLKAFHKADSAALVHKALLLDKAVIDNSALHSRLNTEIENLSKNFAE